MIERAWRAAERLVRFIPGREPRWRDLAVFTLLMLCLCAVFVGLVRLYVVPTLTAPRHWQYGLQKDSDSQVFHLEAVTLADQMRARGWWNVMVSEQFDGLSHTKAFASLYYVFGSNSAYLAYLLNVVLYALASLLFYALVRQAGLAAWTALGAALLICAKPLFLFSYSELLREPFVVASYLLYLLGAVLLIRPPFAGEPGVRAGYRWLAGAATCGVGMVAITTFRPYLLLVLFAGLVLMTAASVVYPVMFTRSPRMRLGQVAVVLGLLVLLTVTVVAPARVQQYTRRSLTPDAAAPAAAAGGPAGAVVPNGTVVLGHLPSTSPLPSTSAAVIELPALIMSDTWRKSWASVTDKSALTRADLVIPHSCTIRWNKTAWVPTSVDAKFEAIACSREDFLRFCNQELLGHRADRFCDDRNFTSTPAALTHLPRTTAFALLVPYPNMWFDGFGSGGTGLRRIGYVLDGILDYFLLTGLAVMIWRARRSRPDLVIIPLVGILMLAVYGLSVPSQFILARLRLALYSPLLAFGAAGWLLLLQNSRAARHNEPSAIP